jgi:hypothetical protein
MVSIRLRGDGYSGQPESGFHVDRVTSTFGAPRVGPWHAFRMALSDGRVAWENRAVPRRVLNPTLALWVIALALDLGGWLVAWTKTDVDPGLLMTWLLASAAIFAFGSGAITSRSVWWVTSIVVLVEWGMLIATIWLMGGWGCPSGSACAHPAIEWFGPVLLASPIVVIAVVGRFAGHGTWWVPGKPRGGHQQGRLRIHAAGMSAQPS